MPGPTQDPQSSSWYTQPTHALGCTCSFKVASPGCGRTVVWGGTTAPLPGERGACRVPVANGRSRRGYGHHGWTRVACPLAHQRLWGFFFNGGLRTSCGSLGDPGDTSSRSRRWAIQRRLRALGRGVSSAVHDDESCLDIGPSDTVTRIGVNQARSARITGFDGGDWSGKGSWEGYASLTRPWMASLPHAL